MQEADYSSSIFVTKIHPIIPRIRDKFADTLRAMREFEAVLVKSEGNLHPYSTVVADLHARINWLFDALKLYDEQPAMPAEEPERQRLVQQMRNQFFLDLMDLRFSPQEISRVTNTSALFLERLRDSASK